MGKQVLVDQIAVKVAKVLAGKMKPKGNTWSPKRSRKNGYDYSKWAVYATKAKDAKYMTKYNSMRDYVATLCGLHNDEPAKK